MFRTELGARIPSIRFMPMDRQLAAAISKLQSRLPTTDENWQKQMAALDDLRERLTRAQNPLERQEAGLAVVMAERALMQGGPWHNQAYWKDVSKHGKKVRREVRTLERKKHVGARGLEAYHFSPRAFWEGVSSLVEMFSPVYRTEIRAGTQEVSRNGETRLEPVFRLENQVRDKRWFVEMAGLGILSLGVVSMVAFAPAVAIGLGATVVFTGGKLISDSFRGRTDEKNRKNVYSSQLAIPQFGASKLVRIPKLY